MKNHNQQHPIIDSRIISLYSRGASALPEFSDYSMFEYFDVIEVQKATEDSSELPLFNAYQKSRVYSESLPHRQVILAFTDVVDDTETEIGFTEDEIENFWEKMSAPILFVTLVNVESAEKLGSVVKKVKDTYPSGRYLIYYTFDCREVLIFLRGSSFQECASLMLQLDSGADGNALLVDAITLYAFNKKVDFSKLKPKTEETFGVYLCFGVANGEGLKEYYKKLTDESLEASDGLVLKKWILGRYDIGIFHPQANLEWINTAMNLADQPRLGNDGKPLPPWYTIRTLSVMISPDESISFESRGGTSSTCCKSLQNRLQNSYQESETAYTKACNRLCIRPDQVWLRWLRDSTNQAVSFLGSNMTSDLGICIVPQFEHFLDFIREMCRNIKTTGDIAWIERCFSTFFSNISVLIDSMNHSYRQFILTPSFFTVAFEMPPKIMAYYIAVSHDLVELFRGDEPENSPKIQYGFSVSPKFARELDVCSLVPEEYSGKSQFITIGVGEECIYRLQHTTTILAHEISHFVGSGSRMRDARKQYILKAELHSIIGDLALKLHNELIDEYTQICTDMCTESPSGMPERDKVFVPWNKITEITESLLKILCDYAPAYKDIQDCCLKKDVVELLYQMPYHIYNNPKLTEVLFEFLWNNLFVNERELTVLGFAASELERIYNMGERTVTDQMKMLNVFVKPRARLAFRTALEQYAEQYGISSGNEMPRLHYRCQLFSETYADLKAVLLFELDWSDYFSLFDECDVTDSVQTRLLVTSRAAKLSRNSTSKTGADEELWSFFQSVTFSGDAEENRRLSQKGIDPPLCFYLVKYLSECADIIREYFEKNEERVRHLRKLYNSLSDEKRVFELLTGLMDYISDYQRTILGNCESSIIQSEP